MLLPPLRDHTSFFASKKLFRCWNKEKDELRSSYRRKRIIWLEMSPWFARHPSQVGSQSVQEPCKTNHSNLLMIWQKMMTAWFFHRDSCPWKLWMVTVEIHTTKAPSGWCFRWSAWTSLRDIWIIERTIRNHFWILFVFEENHLW